MASVTAAACWEKDCKCPNVHGVQDKVQEDAWLFRGWTNKSKACVYSLRGRCIQSSCKFVHYATVRHSPAVDAVRNGVYKAQTLRVSVPFCPTTTGCDCDKIHGVQKKTQAELEWSKGWGPNRAACFFDLAGCCVRGDTCIFVHFEHPPALNGEQAKKLRDYAWMARKKLGTANAAAAAPQTSSAAAAPTATAPSTPLKHINVEAASVQEALVTFAAVPAAASPPPQLLPFSDKAALSVVIGAILLSQDASTDFESVPPRWDPAWGDHRDFVAYAQQKGVFTVDGGRVRLSAASQKAIQEKAKPQSV